MITLEFLVRLLNGKCLYGLTNRAITFILELFRDVLPDGAKVPPNHYEANKLTSDLGFTYQKIHACPNDCMLYWEDTADCNECIRCGVSRWKQNEDGKNSHVPRKVMWHFPIIPRLQRLFLSSDMAVKIRWHAEGRTIDEYMRHPADGLAWKHFDLRHGDDITKEPRNIRLGLSCDGFNPFRQQNIKHSTWPVFLMIYNLPPWMCMKKQFSFMTVLIPGPKEPGNNIDVYLQPLISEFKLLWEKGVPTYDASRDEVFNLHAWLLWTINDFPAYAVLSGWSTKGKLACPICGKHTHYRRLRNGKKFCFMGHRRFLPHNHRYRRAHSSFDGTIEQGVAPKPMSGVEVLKELNGLNVEFGKGDSTITKRKKRRSSDADKHFNWRKRSIFF